MARAIPLTAPNGTVYSYACGVCHNVEGGTTAFGMKGAPKPDLAEHYKEQAEDCCRCGHCKRVMRGGNVVNFCKRCAPAEIVTRERARAEHAREQERLDALVEASLVRALHRGAARQLRDELEELSEDAFCASWETSVVALAWDAVSGDVSSVFSNTRDGAAVIDHLDALRRLSTAAGGWWVQRDGDPLILFVPTSEMDAAST